MLRFLVGLAVVACLAACLVLPISGCSSDKNDTAAEGGSQTQSTAKATDSESRSVIPPKKDTSERIAGVLIKPYFDAAGSVTESAVAAGQSFDFYVFAEYPEPYNVSAAEYRLKLPAGVKVVQESKFNDKALTMGNHKTDFVMAFECVPQGKFHLMKYTCTAESPFKGGKIEVMPGVNTAGISFLGFATCEPDNRKIKAEGGSVTLASK
jgi:hypothetical protein